MTRFSPSLPMAALALTLPLLWTAPGVAQESPKLEQERLEKLLTEVNGALSKLKVAYEPKTTWVEYDLRALFRSAPDRSAPSLKLPTADGGTQTAAGAGGGGGFTFEEPDEAGASGLSPDYVEALLRAGCLESHETSMQIAGGFLHVRTTKANHAITRSILAKLRAERLRCVQVEVGIYALPAALHAELERSSLLQGGILEPAALAKLDAAVSGGQGKLVDAALLSSLGEQSVYFHRGAERAYLSSFARSSGGTEQIVETVSDPVVDALRTGLALQVRPTILEGGQSVLLDLRCARSSLLSMTRRSTPYGPIDVPRLQLTTTNTSTRVPLGAGVLVSASRSAKSPKDAEPQAASTSTLIVVRPR